MKSLSFFNAIKAKTACAGKKNSYARVKNQQHVFLYNYIIHFNRLPEELKLFKNIRGINSNLIMLETRHRNISNNKELNILAMKNRHTYNKHTPLAQYPIKIKYSEFASPIDLSLPDNFCNLHSCFIPSLNSVVVVSKGI